MMPLLERIADMKPDAMETFTPQSMGGDVDLKEAKHRLDNRVCGSVSMMPVNMADIYSLPRIISSKPMSNA